MDDSIGSAVQSQDVSAPVSQAPTQSSGGDERVFRQSEVNDIVKKAKYGAVEDYKRISQQQPEYAQQKHATQAPNEDFYRQLAAEEAQKLHERLLQDANNKAATDYANRIANDFTSKISTGKDKYEDFEQVIGDVGKYARYPNIVSALALHVDNADSVLYDLSKRGQLASLEMQANYFPDDVISQLKNLSSSLKNNETAAKVKLPNEPLSQLRPSNTGTDNGTMSVKDYRKKYRV